MIERTYIFQQSRAELAALIEPQLFEAIHNSEQFRSPLPGRWQFGLVNNEMFVDLRLALDGPGVLHAIHDDGLIEFHYRVRVRLTCVISRTEVHNSVGLAGHQLPS